MTADILLAMSYGFGKSKKILTPHNTTQALKVSTAHLCSVGLD